MTAASSKTVEQQPCESNGLYTHDLARYCLELDPAESKRVLAWVNSICLIYLLIGLGGIKQSAISIQQRARVEEEAVPTVIEPLVTAAQTISADASPETAVTDSSAEDAGPGVAVVADSPAVVFAVPTVGNLLVPMSMAQPPPANPMQGVVALDKPQIEQITITGVGGSRPPPSYPRESLLAREQGTVVLLIEVGESGAVTAVTVKSSSGYARLDRAAMEHVKRTWYFGPAKNKRLYECPFVFQLQ